MLGPIGFDTCSFGTLLVAVDGEGIGKVVLDRRLELIACKGATDSCILGDCGYFSSSIHGVNCTIYSHSHEISNYLTTGNLLHY